MSDFEVGKYAIAIENSKLNDITYGNYYQIQEISNDNVCYLKIITDNGYTSYVLAHRFKPSAVGPEESEHEATQPEDELPPVPENVRYECDCFPGVDYVNVTLHERDSILCIGVSEGEDKSEVLLSADTALDLAADLTRMALQLKRQQEDE